MIDWTDDSPVTLGEAARLAFPSGGVTAATLKRRARQGLLSVTRPGKRYMTTLRDVAAMLAACRVANKPAPVVPRDDDLSVEALDAALAGIERRKR